MKIQNYYDTLSKVQKQKWSEKQGNLCYYEWFDTLYEEYTLEEAGAILLSLMFYDRTGGTQPLPKGLETIIDSDRAMRTIFTTYMEKTAAATKEWINRHKLKNTDETEVVSPYIGVQNPSTNIRTYTVYPNEINYTITYPTQNEGNVPNDDEMQKAFEVLENDVLMFDEFIRQCEDEHWCRNYTEYISELLANQ